MIQKGISCHKKRQKPNRKLTLSYQSQMSYSEKQIWHIASSEIPPAAGCASVSYSWEEGEIHIYKVIQNICINVIIRRKDQKDSINGRRCREEVRKSINLSSLVIY